MARSLKPKRSSGRRIARDFTSCHHGIRHAGASTCDCRNAAQRFHASTMVPSFRRLIRGLFSTFEHSPRGARSRYPTALIGGETGSSETLTDPGWDWAHGKQGSEWIAFKSYNRGQTSPSRFHEGSLNSIDRSVVERSLGIQWHVTDARFTSRSGSSRIGQTTGVTIAASLEQTTAL